MILVLPSDSIKANGHNQKHRKFRLNMRKSFFTARVTENLGNRLLRDHGVSFSGNIQTYLDTIPCNLF